MIKNNLILCIETTTEICSVALSLNGNCIATLSIDEPNAHGSQLSILIDKILHDAGYSIKDLVAVAYSSGPGSYTGLRIGLSTAKGICFGQDIPLIEVATLTHMASRVIHFDPAIDAFLPMLDARRMEVYTALINKDLQVIIPPFACILDEFNWESMSSYRRIAFFGNGASKAIDILAAYERFVHVESYKMDASSICPLAELKFRNLDFVNLALHVPFYLKGAHITTSKKNIL